MPKIMPLIYCTFSRSYDKGTLKKNNVHLICSKYFMRVGLGEEQNNLYELGQILDKNPKLLNNISNTGQLIIIRIEFNFNKEYLSKQNFGNHIIEYHISLYNWIGFLSSFKIENIDSLLEIIIGDLKNQEEKFDSRLNNCLFIFEGFNFITIKNIHSKLGISISGGNTSNRGNLSSVHYRLSAILFLLGIKISQVYESYKELPLLDKNLNDSENNINIFSFDNKEFNIRLLQIMNITKAKEIKELILKNIEDWNKKLQICISEINQFHLNKSKFSNNSPLVDFDNKKNEIEKNIQKYNDTLEQINIAIDMINNGDLNDLNEVFYNLYVKHQITFQDSNLSDIKSKVLKKI